MIEQHQKFSYGKIICKRCLWLLWLAPALLMAVEAQAQIVLTKMWQDGEYWKPETYGTHYCPTKNVCPDPDPKKKYYAADFYYTSRNRPDLLRNYEEGLQGKNILAPRSGKVFIHLLDITSTESDRVINVERIDANRVIQGTDSIPDNSFVMKDRNGDDRKIDLELVIDEPEFRILLAHLQISSRYFSGAVPQKIRNAISAFLDPQKKSSIAIDTGQNVNIGEVVGTVNWWGIARLYHLHLNVFRGRGYSEASPALGNAIDLSDATQVNLETRPIFAITAPTLEATRDGVYQHPAMPRRRLMPNETVVVATRWDNASSVRARDSAGGSILTQVNEGTIGQILAGPTVAKIVDGNTWHVWYQVRFPNINITGWVAAEYIDTAQSTPTYTYSLSQGLNLISFPFAPKPARFSELFAQLGSDLFPFVFFIKDDGVPDYRRAQDMFAEPKKGYFLYLQNPRTITISGAPVDKGITLRQGLNLIGVTEQITPTSNSNIYPEAFFLEGGSPRSVRLFENGLRPGVGYFVLSQMNGTVLIPGSASASFTGDRFRITEASATTLWRGRRNDNIEATLTSDDFVAEFKIEQPGAATPPTPVILKFGVKPGATDGFDAGLDQPRALPFPGQLAGFFDESFHLSESYKSSGGSKEWPIVAISQSPGFGQSDNLNPVRLSWTIPSGGSIPANARFELLDANRNVVIANMRSTTSASFNVSTPGTQKQYIVRMIIEGAPSDTTPPTVTIISPTVNPTYDASSSPLTLSGTASDNVGVTQVTWANNRGGNGTASGTTNWTANGIALQGGTNLLTITARDAAGNIGTATLTVTYTPPPETFTEMSFPLMGVNNSSAVWGDYDNDGDLDILLTGQTNTGQRIAKIYRNDGGGVFTDVQAALTSVFETGEGSSAWGDYDNDGDLDILLTGSGSGDTPVTKIYRNDNGNFVDINASLTSIRSSSVAWGDYDNDGDLDILLAGATGGGSVSKIYRNDGSGEFTDINASLPGVADGCVSWADYDGDGDLDILLTGSSNSAPISKIYRNDGSGVFSDTNAPLPGVVGSAAWGDYDSDGDSDILLAGMSSTGAIAGIYRNDNGVFMHIPASLRVAEFSSVAWGDYDNDGDLDILLTGASYSPSGPIAKVYRNDGGSFVDVSAPLIGVARGSVVWGDYDNDGDLDILLSGDAGANYISKIYRNNIGMANAVPSTPTGLATTVMGNSVTFTWNKSSDTQTAQNALTYNVRIGTSPSAAQKLSPMADTTTGYRKVPRPGNTGHKNSWTIKNLPNGAYYWSVQAIDNAFAGSTFAAEQTFVIQPSPASIQVTVQTNPSGRSFTVDGTSYTTAQTFTWPSGSTHTISATSPQSEGVGTQYVWDNWSDGGVISHTISPTSNTTYTANFVTQHYLTMSAGAGGAISPSSDWYNSGQSVTITAAPNSGYSFSGWSGSGAGSYTGTGNPATVTMNGPITEMANFALSDFSISASPQTRTVIAGNSTTYTVTTATASGNAQTVSLSVSGLPSGATASFSPSQMPSGSSSTLTITTNSSTPSGNYKLTITGSGSTSRSAEVNLIANKPVACVSAASYSASGIAAEAIIAAFGSSLATATLAASTSPLPTALAGTTVRIKDSAGTERPALLFFVSPTQVNFLVPPGTAPGSATVTITSGDGSVSGETAQIAAVAPGLFAANANGQGVAAAVVLRAKADGSQTYEPVTRFDPAQNRFVAAPIDLGPPTDQVFLILYGTGIRHRGSISTATSQIGGADAQVLYAGAQGGFVGLDQVNLRVPRSLIGRGEVDITLTVDGKIANTVKASIK